MSGTGWYVSARLACAGQASGRHGRCALEQLLQANRRLHTAYPGLKVLTYTLPEILNHPDNTHSLCRRTSFLLTLKRGDRVSPCWRHHGDGHLSSYNQLRRTEEGK